MLLEYVPGGELFTFLRTAHRFDAPTSVFFAAEIVMALDYLHSQNIVYRCELIHLGHVTIEVAFCYS